MSEADLIRYWQALCDLIEAGEFDRAGAIEEAARLAGIDRTVLTLH